MFEILSIMATTTVVFLIGINVGYRLGKDEKPVVTPKIEKIVKSIPTTKPCKEEKKEEKEINEQEIKNQETIERWNKIMTNIERFDGTENGQMEVK